MCRPWLVSVTLGVDYSVVNWEILMVSTSVGAGPFQGTGKPRLCLGCPLVQSQFIFQPWYQRALFNESKNGLSRRLLACRRCQCLERSRHCHAVGLVLRGLSSPRKVMFFKERERDSRIEFWFLVCNTTTQLAHQLPITAWTRTSGAQ